MAARKDKSEEDLILDDKIDLARTLVRLRERQSTRRELNEIEPSLVAQHEREVKAGAVSRVNFDPRALIQPALEPQTSERP